MEKYLITEIQNTVSVSEILNYSCIKQWFLFSCFQWSETSDKHWNRKYCHNRSSLKLEVSFKSWLRSQRWNSKLINSLEKWNGGTLILVCDVPMLYVGRYIFVNIFEASWVLFRLKQMPGMPWYFWLIYSKFTLTSLEVSRLS